MPETHPCPKCGKPTVGNHDLLVDGEIKNGGCGECWTASYKAWWDRLIADLDRQDEAKAEQTRQLSQGVQING